MTKYIIKQVDGGFVIYQNGVKIDWPVLATRAEAEAEVYDFINCDREYEELERDELRMLAEIDNGEC